jgi:arsenate reductase
MRRGRRASASPHVVSEAASASMNVTIWHNPKCSTSRKVLDAIRAKGVEPKILLYAQSPPGEREIKSFLKEAKLAPRDLLRRKGTPYEELALDNPRLTDSDLVTLMHEHPLLIERPVVITDKGARLCRPPERVEEIL